MCFCVCFVMQVAEKYELKKASQSLAFRDKTESRNVVRNIYCDQPADDTVHSSPSWHDNVLSAGKESGVRSPLSVIGWSPGGRKLIKGDLAAKKAAMRGSDLASAKKAVAELIATVEMDTCKENASPRLQQKQLGSNRDKPPLINTDKPASVNRIEGADLKNAKNMESVVDTTASNTDEGNGVKQGLLIEQIDEDDFDSDVENKENVFHGWSTDEIVEISDNFDVDKMVTDTVEQLDKQARTLRRRSQMSTDSSEYESILQQLKLVRQRQTELEKLQMKLHSQLVQCQPTSIDEQPLNLKLNSACEVERVDRDVMEPLDLRIPLVKQCQEFTHKNNAREILADITSEVIGDADPNDCFEVPDSPPPAATDADNSSPVKDADEGDRVLPVSENFASDNDCTVHIQTNGDFMESGQMKSTPIRLSPADCSVADTDKAHVVGILDQYLASLNVSDISEADSPSPTSVNVASPDTSSEFSNYKTYQRSLDASGRCLDPIAAALLDGDEQVCCLH